MPKLPPTLRLKRRYLLISGEKESIEKAILNYTGLLGWAKTAPFFVDKHKSGWVLAVNRQELVNVRAAMAVSEADLKILRVSGTIKGLE